jgi:hypothetical protein
VRRAPEGPGVGPHPGSKRLIAYHEGSLPAAEREALQEHLSLCPRCARSLLELRDFEAAAAAGGAAGPESLRQEAWDSLVRRRPRQAPAVRSIAEAAARRAPRRRTSTRLLAAALLLAVLGLAAWEGIRLRQERQRLAAIEARLSAREEALAAARRSLVEAERRRLAARGGGQLRERERIDRGSADAAPRRAAAAPENRAEPVLVARAVEVSVAPRFVLRGGQDSGGGLLRGGGAVNPVRAHSPGDGFTVALSLADYPVYPEYRLELTDRGGKTLWSGRRPGGALLGDAGTSVSVRGLGPGLYRLRVAGLPRGELLAEYLLEVEPQATPE